jgi:hypothetical protein
MNVIVAHKDELQKLLEDLSSDRLVSGITFVALVNAYIARLDANCLDIAAGVSMRRPCKQMDDQYLEPTSTQSRSRYNFITARRALPQISRCGPQASAGCSPATVARRTFTRLPLLRDNGR